MLIHGGSGPALMDEPWSLSLSGTPTWTLLPTFGESRRSIKRWTTSKTIYPDIVGRTTGGNELPTSFAFGIRTNPVSATPAIQYSLPREALVRLSVFDVAGREVGRLVDGRQQAGRHTAIWESSPRPGIHLVRYETPVGAWTRRMVLIR
jgi:hypothetical protein